MTYEERMAFEKEFYGVPEDVREEGFNILFQKEQEEQKGNKGG